MAAANLLENLWNSLRDHIAKSQEDIEVLKKVIRCVIKKVEEDASRLEKAREAKLCTRLPCARKTRNNSKFTYVTHIMSRNSLPAGPETRRGRRRLVSDKDMTITLCVIKDGKLVHHKDFTFRDAANTSSLMEERVSTGHQPDLSTSR